MLPSNLERPTDWADICPRCLCRSGHSPACADPDISDLRLRMLLAEGDWRSWPAGYFSREYRH
jgi:hypothetical protein